MKDLNISSQPQQPQSNGTNIYDWKIIFDIDFLQVKMHNAARRKEIEEKIQAWNADPNNKDHLNMVVIGHVDAGKSTTMGHLLFKLG